VREVSFDHVALESQHAVHTCHTHGMKGDVCIYRERDTLVERINGPCFCSQEQRKMLGSTDRFDGAGHFFTLSSQARERGSWATN
jgi:hypothetical protein